MKNLLLATLLLATCGLRAVADDRGPFTIDFEELAPGVWAGVRPDAPRAPVMGTTVFVIGDASVVVFDGGGVAAMADLVIGKIRSLTDLPVSDVVISHWHGDHNFGVYRFAEEYPEVRFIAHEFTSAMLDSSKMSYLDRQENFRETRLSRYQEYVRTGTGPGGESLNAQEVAVFQGLIDDIDIIDSEFSRSRVTPADITFSRQLTLDPGGRRIELLYPGYGNTAGDAVMWLPAERIVAVGDIVVLPSPYAFNVPPREWADTLRAIKALDFAVLVPGHGPVQKDTAYIDLLIATADDIARQRDALVAAGTSPDEIAAALDFSDIEPRFTGGDEYLAVSYRDYFEQPFREAAVKELTGEPMVPVPVPELVSFDDERWQFGAADYEVADYLGQKALRIRGGLAVLPDVDVRNAIVEFDVAVSGDRGFAGVVFRLQDNGNYENFYIRPHQSGNPDANQYQPVFNGVDAWQLYYGEGYAAPVAYRSNEWMHVRIQFANKVAKVFIDSDEPVLVVEDLKRDVVGGSIGLAVANFADAWFANFRYMPLANAYEFPYPGKGVGKSAPGVITSWRVSSAFDRAEIAGASSISREFLEEFNWTSLDSEPSGIANLARVQGRGPGADTAFACAVVNSEVEETQQLQFGYSDAATVFINGTRVYSGDNSYESRDYRYLGTIGLFDAVPVRLQPGSNEICIAVAERFGGWGVTGKLQSL